MVAGLVRLPGARAAWHSHANGQTLHVTHGIARMQSHGGDIITVSALIAGGHAEQLPYH